MPLSIASRKPCKYTNGLSLKGDSFPLGFGSFRQSLAWEKEPEEMDEREDRREVFPPMIPDAGGMLEDREKTLGPTIVPFQLGKVVVGPLVGILLNRMQVVSLHGNTFQAW